MSKIIENKLRKQQKILAAAQQIFLSDGFTLANMDKIAELAQVTKQTIYRYFPSKTELFKATLSFIGEQNHQGYFEKLELSDTEQALNDFAVGFIKAHLSDDHLAAYRLLVFESQKAPEIIEYFMQEGPESTTDKLSIFFQQRLSITQPEQAIELWCAMLLSFRDQALLTGSKPTDKQIKSRASEATHWLLSSQVAP